MHVVRDGSRQLKFDGDKLAESSSRFRGRTRWVEFRLYRTTGGQYVLGRVGVSLYYHSGDCEVVERNSIPGVRTEEVSTALVPCEICSPVPENEDLLHVEEPRYWALVSDSGAGVVKALYKRGADGLYLTKVSRRLLEDASRIDDEIYDAYYTEEIL